MIQLSALDLALGAIGVMSSKRSPESPIICGFEFHGERFETPVSSTKMKEFSKADPMVQKSSRSDH